MKSTLSDAKKRAPKRGANINPSLQYYSILLAYKFSGKPRKKPDRKKQTKSFRQNYCNAVEVLRINLEHSPEISKDLYESLPRQRLPPDHVLEETKSAIKLKAYSKLGDNF